ncbi:mlr0571 [Mesorhizobium japonicum MAFF 303099]|uniref:Mlr0571 protein n=1 Tax=Mesorhizobium japonicum (strain LMG 29417 / CECT 9101 / MAFF 303099) TaxID=266835 RepID=Q98MI1_RHILO|nr:mlr0571 [Mesorhizobium japonicum MAFF 303099]
MVGRLCMEPFAGEGAGQPGRRLRFAARPGLGPFRDRSLAFRRASPDALPCKSPPGDCPFDNFERIVDNRHSRLDLDDNPASRTGLADHNSRSAVRALVLSVAKSSPAVPHHHPGSIHRGRALTRHIGFENDLLDEPLVRFEFNALVELVDNPKHVSIRHTRLIIFLVIAAIVGWNFLRKGGDQHDFWFW